MPPILLLTNISKRPNALSILRTCLTYNIKIVIHGMHNQVKDILNLYNKLSETPNWVPATFGKSGAGISFLNVINCEYNERDKVHVMVPRSQKVNLESVPKIISENINRHVKVCAIEIPDLEKYEATVALPIDEITVETFRGFEVLLMLGNEGSGCSEKQLGMSECFLWCKQFSGDTASFNVAVAFAIVAERVCRVVE
ncbi:hypothetical protein TrVE_jg13047 [Triparma verrucosa]|uniref:tRNA/rRNA methyltransferase SpoU type domain-containing protein n=1 Tax=Triparma verrucosa TaxID=1606542 RepID=A0A9W7F858_9STRA|nr:hypothetical protein TrVE_jg13047 [Triparma verrucosa]